MLDTARFAILIDHDDAERDFAYGTGAERACGRDEHREPRHHPIPVKAAGSPPMKIGDDLNVR
jgi:hypothetical protein